MSEIAIKSDLVIIIKILLTRIEIRIGVIFMIDICESLIISEG